MKKILLASALIFAISTSISTIPAEAQTKTYYQTKLASASGKKYNMTLRSSNAKKIIADDLLISPNVNVGDVLYNGTFNFYINGKKTALKTNEQYNKTGKNFYKIATKKGTPTFFATTETIANNVTDVTLYYMYKGKPVKLKNGFFTTLKPKYVKKNVIKIANYDNNNWWGYDIHYLKINPKTADYKIIKSERIHGFEIDW